VTEGRTVAYFVVCLYDSINECEVKNMNLSSKQLSGASQLWVNKVERKHPSRVDYYSALRSWVHHVILEAEKNNDFKKKDRFLKLLEGL
jgi:hypothetical protein